jgi:hypothetical protein
VALSEWGMSPDEINETWTDELLYLMFNARRELLEGYGKKPSTPPSHDGVNLMSADELFKKMSDAGSKAINVVKY